MHHVFFHGAPDPERYVSRETGKGHPVTGVPSYEELTTQTGHFGHGAAPL